MPDFSDLFGSLFGGGGGSPFSYDPSSILGAGSVAPDVSDFLTTTQPFNFSNLFSTLGDVGSTIGNIGGNLGGLFGGGAPDLNTINFGPMTGGGGGGGTPVGQIPNISQLLNPLVKPAVTSLLGGGGGGGGTPAGGGQGQPGGAGTTPGGGTVAPGSTTPPGVPAQGGGTPAGGGGGIPGLGGLGGLLPGGGSFADILSAAGLLGGLLKKDSLPPQAGDLTKLADSMGQQGQNQLATATANQQGMINDQALGRVERSLRQRQASIRKSYADMGMSGSTMEAQDLNDASQAADQEVFSVGQEMATTGLQTALSMFGDQQSIMQNLMQDQIEQDKELSDAMAEFAGAAVRYDGTNNPAGGGAGAASLTNGQNSLTGGVPLNIASSVIHDLIGSTPLGAPQTVNPGVDVGSLIAPLLNVPGLVPTGGGLPDPSQLDPNGG